MGNHCIGPDESNAPWSNKSHEITQRMATAEQTYSESFAFNYHKGRGVPYVEFRRIRGASDEEKKMNEEVYVGLLELYPIVIRCYKSGYVGCGSFDLKWFIDNDEDAETNDFTRISRMEIWSIF